MAMQTTATINGITYRQGDQFVARVRFVGREDSEGHGAYSVVSQGETYNFRYYYPGQAYPYAVGLGSSTNTRCWVQIAPFPFAEYTISYNANGGSDAPDPQTKVFGTNLALSEKIPVREGYGFLGWSTVQNGSVVYPAGTAYTANAEATLYAVWEPNVYRISFNGNGGTGAPAAIEKVHDQQTTLPSTIPKRTGYNFLGWSTIQNATTAQYQAGGVINLNYTAILYAVWTAKVLTVTFDKNDGSGEKRNQSFTYGQSGNVFSVTFSRYGKVLKGWSFSADGSTKIYPVAATVVDSFINSYAPEITLYAIWAKDVYVITFNASANGGIGDTTVNVEHGESIELPVATREYYKFIGWFTAKSGGTKITDSYVFTSAITLYAQFEPDASEHVYDGTNWIPGYPHAFTGQELVQGYKYVYDGSSWVRGVS